MDRVGGLGASRSYPSRPFATAGVPAPRVLGPIDAFTTLAAPAGGGAGTTPGFGSKMLVTLKLASRRIAIRGPLAVRVSNGNSFPVSGRLSGQTTKRVSVARKRRIKLKARSFRVAAHTTKTVKLKLPKALRRLLGRNHKLSLRLTAKVKDPAGHTRSVNKLVKPKLRKKRMRRATTGGP
jgi:hypothetical protein